jgi:Uma2 family endonuclease
MMATTRLMTAEDLWQLDDDEYRYDLLRGELIRMSSATYRHGKLGMRIARKIADFADEHDLGEIPSSETGFILARDPDVVLAPDVAFVRKEQLPPDEEQDRFLELAPDLVVEVVSPSDRWTEINDKVMEYLRHGVALVWIVDPRLQQVTVYAPDRGPRVVTIEDQLDGGEVLPEFRLSVAEIFE